MDNDDMRWTAVGLGFACILFAAAAAFGCAAMKPSCRCECCDMAEATGDWPKDCGMATTCTDEELKELKDLIDDDIGRRP